MPYQIALIRRSESRSAKASQSCSEIAYFIALCDWNSVTGIKSLACDGFKLLATAPADLNLFHQTDRFINVSSIQTNVVVEETMSE